MRCRGSAQRSREERTAPTLPGAAQSQRASPWPPAMSPPCHTQPCCAVLPSSPVPFPRSPQQALRPGARVDVVGRGHLSPRYLAGPWGPCPVCVPGSHFELIFHRQECAPFPGEGVWRSQQCRDRSRPGTTSHNALAAVPGPPPARRGRLSGGHLWTGPAVSPHRSPGLLVNFRHSGR